MKEQRTLIFFHIAKTAGMTLDWIIARVFPQDNIYLMNGSLNPQCVTEFISLPVEQREKVKYLHAHLVPFGVHEFLPGETIYVTFIRNPVERVISRYYHYQRRPEDAEHDRVIGLSLEEFATANVLEGDTHNGQTRAICGIRKEDWTISAKPLSEEHLEEAKANLRQHFSIVGISERFDEFLVILKRSMGWKIRDILYVKQNVGRNRPTNERLSSDTIKLIQENNQLDFQLYEFAKQLFEESIRQQEVSFKRDLRLFLICNMVYGFIMGIYNKLYMTADLLVGLIKLLLALAKREVQFSYVYGKILARLKT